MTEEQVQGPGVSFNKFNFDRIGQKLRYNPMEFGLYLRSRKAQLRRDGKGGTYVFLTSTGVSHYLEP